MTALQQHLKGRWAGPALVAVALAYGAGQYQSWRIPLGWDESIYLSQVSRVVPPAFFSAPRARGIAWLAAPLRVFTPSVTGLRLYLTGLGALALLVAFRIWFPVLGRGAAVLAAALFASLWVARFYGDQLMPNLWVAFGLVAAVGGFLRLVAEPRDRTGLLALPAGLALAAVMRPPDAAWAVAALLGLAMAVPGRRRIGIAALALAGAALGALPWVIEAEQRFGGVPARLRAASAIQGGLGWYPGLLAQHWRTIDGPLLCRPCTPAAVPPLDAIWPVAIPVAAVVTIGLALAARPVTRAGTLTALAPVVVGAAVATPYLFLVGYSAPRFLLPAYGLLALAVGAALQPAIARAAGGLRSGRPVAAALVLLLLAAGAGQVLAQQRVLSAQARSTGRSTRRYVQVAAALTATGIRPPCVVSGVRSPQIAFYARCRSRNVGGHDGSVSAAGLLALAAHEPVVLVLAPGQRPPAFARHWRYRPLPVPGRPRPWAAYLAPSLR